jgi:hypothetical protein
VQFLQNDMRLDLVMRRGQCAATLGMLSVRLALLRDHVILNAL